MIFDTGYIYHVYNQGNNRQNIFYKRENYVFFLQKLEVYIKPYAAILAYCLMPNHFHLMILVNSLELKIPSQGVVSQGFTLSETLTSKKRSINDSIGIMLRSYTRAINKQEGFSGALFRKETKAECISCPKGLMSSFVINNDSALISSLNPENQYPQLCFNYIHQNPVKAGLVKQETEWEFSSADGYTNRSANNLIDINIAKEYGLF